MGCNLPEKYMKGPGYLKKKKAETRDNARHCHAVVGPVMYKLGSIVG
jgi:hypothetical protein